MVIKGSLCKTVCLRCHQKCDLEAEVNDGKIVRILGAACVKGVHIPDVMYHKDRLTYPIKRNGKRGGGKWERISWDEAIGTIADKLSQIKQKYGPEAIHISSGSGQKHIGYQTTRIARKLFPTPNIQHGRYTCIIPDNKAAAATVGEFLTYEFCADFEHSGCIVFWGSNPDVTTPHQVREVYKALKGGAKLIVIDPRPIPMAKRADVWLRIRPGTDAALALAMLHVIVNEGLYDKDFVEKWCVGFDQLRDHVRRCTPDWAAGITWLSKEDIVKAARLYATTKPGTVYIRLGVGGQHINSTQSCRAIHLLIAICGNIDVPGGNLLTLRGFGNAGIYHTYLMMNMGIRGPAEVESKQMGIKVYPLMTQCDEPEVVRGMHDGRIRGLWCVADNLIVAEMDSGSIWEAMRDKLEFIFVSEFFMTPTAELADVVLPAAFYTEVDNVTEAFSYPYNYITACRKVVEPLGECWDDRKVAIEIARGMGADVRPWESVIDFLNWRLKYTGITFDELWARPKHRLEFPREFRRYERSTPPFFTPSGKVELYSSLFESVGLDPLPNFIEPPESPVSTPELYKEFPLIYTHYRLVPYEHSEDRQIERARKMEPDPCLEISPETASECGVKEGDWVYLETPRFREERRVQYKVRLAPGMLPGVVAGPHAWWFPERPGPEHGCFDSNINALLSLAPPYDPVVGNVQCRAILCRIGKVEETANSLI
jgi:anaerobic selenocysteine-containing dehydrogenase